MSPLLIAVCVTIGLALLGSARLPIIRSVRKHRRARRYDPALQAVVNTAYFTVYHGRQPTTSEQERLEAMARDQVCLTSQTIQRAADQPSSTSQAGE